ncbi:hypothetical protein C2W62_25640 [Candidatus Entotheonella serta]|nr:hypothetical protein C2W62_25640 [Candidatus Entotheonella serta]
MDIPASVFQRPCIKTALHQNDISLALSKALYEQFCLRIATIRDAERQEKVKRNKAVGERGRTPGAGRGPRLSKLDQHFEAIVRLLASGISQKEIAKRYGTTPSNLHAWLKRRGLK